MYSACPFRGSMRISRSPERTNGGSMRRLDVFACALVAVIGVPALGFAQWIRYPTADLPRNADGKLNLTAPAPRLPDGHPDLSGLWHAAQPRQCVNAAGDSVQCGNEIG